MTDVASLKTKILESKGNPNLDDVIKCLGELADLVEQLTYTVKELIISKK